MLRIVMLLLATLPVLAASPDPSGVLSQPLPAATGLGLTLDFPEPELESVPGGVSVRLQGEGLWGQAGCPDLPAVVRHVRIPARSGVQVRVEEAVWTSLGQRTVAPMQERLHTEAELPLPWFRDEAVYGMDAAWPQEWIRLSEPMLMREIRLVTLTVAPLRWNPVSGELQRLERLRVELTFQGRDDTNMPLRDEEEGLSDESEGLIYAAQAAEEQFIRQMMGHRLLDPVTGTDWSEAGSLDAITWSAPALPLNYLVIAKAAAVAQPGLQDWLTWKRRKGHHVTVLTESNMTWTATGIRNAIISQYTSNTLHPPHYVMLVGDPVETPYALPTDPTQYDHYYAAIAGNDILADVVVGRISVTSAGQLNNVMAKIVGYETAPYLENTSWLRRASFLTGQGHCGESMSQLSRDIAFQLRLERGYTQTDTAFCANSPSYVYSWFNQGISHYTYRGWGGMEGLSTSQLMNLQQGPRTPIAVVFTCNSGDFAESWYEPAFTEAFLRGGTVNTPGAAAAAMGFCTPNTHTAYNNLVAGGFWSALLNHRIPQVGTCMFRGKLELFNTLPAGDSNVTNFSRWANLMGDPGMEQWCGVPDSLRLAGLPGELGTGAQLLELTLSDGEGAPVEGVAVCAWMSGDEKVIGLTNAAGLVQLELPGYPEGSLQITATKAFCVPVLRTVHVDVDNATPVLTALTVADASGDGLLTPGETCTLSFTVSNSSTSATLPAMSLVAELVDAASGMIVDGTAELPEVGPLGSIELIGELQLSVDSQWTDGLPLELTLRLGGGVHLMRASLPVSTPAIHVLSSAWVTTPLYPGETKDWALRLENRGTRTARDLSIHATFGTDDLLSVTPDSHQLDSLAAGASQLLTFSITAAANLVPGFTMPLYLFWGDASIQASGVASTAVALGNQQVTDPTGPDAHGYYAFESSDSQWMQSPTYNWIEIAPNAGGTGTVVNLHDNGDEQDDSRRVNLPFPFQVYGETYSSMAVCSNGFVAFGELAHLQTDFRNHFLPCGMGPEPMLAPMWDDFNLEGDAQVVTQYLPDQHVFVVEWYRMRTNSNNAINTFQLLLYDPAVYTTPTGDGEFVYQYHTFADNQSNDQDFPYCTVGLKNQDATIGLTLLNYRQRPSTAAAFAAGKAVRFSTSIGLNVDPAVLNLSAEELDFRLSETTQETVSDSLVIGNSGVAPLIWQASIRMPDNWPPPLTGGRDQGGPDSFGYTWMDSEEEGGPAFGWVDVWEAGTEVAFTDEDITSAPIDLPFPFPFYGELKTQLWVHSNGFVAFTEPQGGHWQNNVAVPGTSVPNQSILAWWDDLMSDESFNGYVRFWTNDADSVVVTWNAVPHNNPVSYGGPFTFQVVLESNGRYTLNYGDMSQDDPDSDSGTIAVQLNSSTGFAIRRMLIARDNLSIRVLPPAWLSLSSAFGAVASGEEGVLTLHARNDLQGLLLPAGDYTAQVELRTNDPEHATVLLPVTLRVSDVALDPGAGPAGFALGQAVPNPFNPVAHLELQVPMAGPVRADLFNVAGQYVGTVFRGELPAGTHALRVDGSRLASGVYLLKVEAGPHSAVRKLTLLK